MTVTKRFSFGVHPCLALAIICLPSLSVWANPQYASSIIERPAGFDSNEYDAIQWVDLNGDGNKDLLWQGWSETNGRELLLFEQQADGRFSNAPTARVEIKKEIVAYATADIRTEPGEELLFFTGSAVYSYSTRRAGYADNLKKLFDWPLIKSVPDKKRTVNLGRQEDLNGDGRVDLLLPSTEGYGVFVKGEDESFEFLGAVPKAYDDKSKTGRNTRTAFDRLFAERPYKDMRQVPTAEKDQASLNVGNILLRRDWISSVHPAHINGDDLLDFVYLSDPVEGEKYEKQLNLVMRDANSSIPAEPTVAAALTLNNEIESVSFIDISNDRSGDVVITTDDSLSLFLNRSSNFNFKKADQALKFDATGFNSRFVDLDGDQLPELCVTTYDVSALGAVVTADLENIAVDRNVLIYKNQLAQSDAVDTETVAIYPRRPNSKIGHRVLASRMINADSLEGLLSSFNPPEFIEDVNGDDIKDVALVDDNGIFNLLGIDPQLNIATEPLWRFVPQKAIWGIDAYQLNGDALSDFVLTHEKAVTVLVSEP